MSPAALSANPRYQLLSEQILAARGEDIAIDIAGAERLEHHRRLDRARGRLHQHPVPRADLARTSSRRTGTPRRRSPASSSRSAPTRRTCSARSCGARPGSRCSSRPPTPAARSSRRRACGRGCGSASAGSPRSSTCSRRTSATSRRCCRSPTTRTRSRCSRPAAPRTLARAAAAQRHDLPLEPAGLRHRRRRAAPAGGEPRARRPARRSPTRWPTPRSTSAWSARSPRASGRCGRRCRSAPPRRTSTSPPSTGIDAQVYWPGVGQVPATELVLRRLLPMAHAGARRAGASPAEERDRLLGIIEQRCLTGVNGAEWFVAGCTARGRRGPVRRAARDAAGVPRADAHQRARAHLGLSPASRLSAGRSRRQLRGRRRCAGRASRAG